MLRRPLPEGLIGSGRPRPSSSRLISMLPARPPDVHYQGGGLGMAEDVGNALAQDAPKVQGERRGDQWIG
jgi:hypothetical protein